jgi:hypothetical protein
VTARLRDSTRGGLYLTLFRWLSAAKADRVIVVLGFVSLLPSLATGLGADDYLETVMLDRPSPVPGFERSPFDIFRFCDPRYFAALFDYGIFSWWDDPNTRIAFMRPLTAATHALDHALYRNHAALYHLHSALWALWLFFGVRELYRALILDRVVRNLALALYALDDARGWLVSWVAARNAVIATGLSVWALVSHHAARSGRLPRWAVVAGPAVFALALLAGEGSVSTLGYLLGYALFLERAPLRNRLASLAPYAVVALGWAVAYKALGFGAHGSSLYVDPLTNPAGYLAYLFTHGPLLLGSQFGGLWSDVSALFFIAPRGQWLVYGLTWAWIAWVFWLMRGQLRSSTLAQFACTGLAVSLLPAVMATPAMDRLLTWIALGGSILLAQLMAPLLRDPTLASGTRAHRFGVGVLLLAHLLGALLLPGRSRGSVVMRDILDRTDSGVPRDADITDKTLVWVNPPLLPYAGYLPIERAALGLPFARRQHVLASGTSDIELTRLDDHTLRVRPRAGFLIDPVSKMLWSKDRPFHVGERVVQADMTVTVLGVDEDGKPLEIDARFDKSLDDPSYLWVDWRGTRSSPWTPPAAGHRVELPGADYVQAVMGVKLPFEARY